MNKAMFLDRDGVINTERGTYTYRIEDFTFVKDIKESLKLIQEAGYLIIIITNQGGIAKELFENNDVIILHNHIVNELKKDNITITDIYFCPHHSEIENCICRKPNTLMLEKAINKHQVDPSKSFFIGDKKSDVQAGQNIGAKGIRVKENQSILHIIKKLIAEN